MARRGASVSERRERHAEVDDPAVVLEAGARFLEARPRSVSEVRRRLSSAGYRPALVETAIERLTELGFLDDEAFARSWIESRDRAHPRGARALRSELRQKGIADEVVTQVLADRSVAAEGSDDTIGGADEAAALHLLERKATFLARAHDPRDRRQRAYVMLVRNGFDSELAWRAAATVAAPGGSDEDAGDAEAPEAGMEGVAAADDPTS